MQPASQGPRRVVGPVPIPPSYFAMSGTILHLSGRRFPRVDDPQFDAFDRRLHDLRISSSPAEWSAASRTVMTPVVSVRP